MPLVNVCIQQFPFFPFYTSPTRLVSSQAPDANLSSGSFHTESAPERGNHAESWGNFTAAATKYSQEEQDSRVGHGIGEAEDATAHDGITQIENRHSEGCGSRTLKDGNKLSAV